MPNRIVSIGVAFLLLLTGIAIAEPQVIVDRNAGGDATGAFKFARVPAPSKTDAAGNATFSLVAGRRDGNGGELAQLNDGRLPGDQDEPGDNFFFAQGTNGGRIVVDLGEAIDIKAVNTYSWHTSTRGPQVYVLWAADGKAAGFNAAPPRRDDPAPLGWTRIAAVDTRPEGEAAGGQYGVGIRGDGDKPLGKYRYLLFDIERTEGRDSFGNTFFSEIDVDDGRQHLLAAATRPAAGPNVLVIEDGKYEIAFDTSEVPELAAWVDAKLKPACGKWYPIIVGMLPSDGYTAPRRATVTFRKDMGGVAHCAGTRIECSGNWFRRNLEGEAVGAVVHELVHVAQQYGRRRGGMPNPSWLVEGVADYIRWFNFEPERNRPRVDPRRAKYTDSYRTTAAFLDYVTKEHDKEIVKKLNAAMREGRYSADAWKDATGKTVDELWELYIKTLTPR